MKSGYNFSLMAIVLLFLFSIPINAQIINGADLLFSENQNLISGKKIGVVCNHTALLSNGKHLVDALLEQKNVKVNA
ncbi:MAG TPA: hypothetical protein PLH53_11995, partial [Ignavibacteriaceae bacterium]|nr:hypothetical protein [Ignavibacteriaceae bacterium]